MDRDRQRPAGTNGTAPAAGTGLVLEGGGMRALFTAGVLDGLYAAGIRFAGIIAVSAGAAFGCNFKSGQPGRALRYNVRYCRDSRYWGLKSLLSTGDLFNADFCYRAIPRELDPWDAAAFEADPTRFWVVATDADTAEPACTELARADDPACDWIRASASMPGVSRPVPIGGRRWLDGGISDAIPLARFQSMGYRRNVVILTRPAGYRKQSTRLSSLVARTTLRRLPAIAEAMATRPERYNRALDHVAEEEARGTAFVIRPPCPLPVGRATRSPDALRRTHAIGLEAARLALPSLRAWLAASP
jgi:predicted patatin/cPLA2 family phospholipase